MPLLDGMKGVLVFTLTEVTAENAWEEFLAEQHHKT
jgi:hypothetical protein